MAENRPRFPLYLHLALGQVSCILGSFGILGYLIYGSNVPQIVTDTLTTGAVAQVVRVTLIIAVMFTYPLQLYPVIEIAESAFFTKINTRGQSNLSGVIAGPSVSVMDSRHAADSDGINGGSISTVLVTSGTLSTSCGETDILLPKDSETVEPQFKVRVHSIGTSKKRLQKKKMSNTIQSSL